MGSNDRDSSSAVAVSRLRGLRGLGGLSSPTTSSFDGSPSEAVTLDVDKAMAMVALTGNGSPTAGTGEAAGLGGLLGVVADGGTLHAGRGLSPKGGKPKRPVWVHTAGVGHTAGGKRDPYSKILDPYKGLL